MPCVGMVLVRSESGQLLMIHQQTLAQMQSQSQSAMTPRAATPTSTPPVQITSVQVHTHTNHLLPTVMERSQCEPLNPCPLLCPAGYRDTHDVPSGDPHHH